MPSDVALAGSSPSADGGPGARSVRGARRIVVGVAAAIVVLIGLAGWVFLVPVTIDHDGFRNGGSSTIECGTRDSIEISGIRDEVDQRCVDAETERRNTALVLGAVVVTLIFAVSTWPSRRLTGESLDGS